MRDASLWSAENVQTPDNPFGIADSPWQRTARSFQLFEGQREFQAVGNAEGPTLRTELCLVERSVRFPVDHGDDVELRHSLVDPVNGLRGMALGNDVRRIPAGGENRLAYQMRGAPA